MAKTSVEIDSVKLARVREILGTETVQDTIDQAFQAVIRVEAVDELIALAQDGAFTALLEPIAEDRTW